MIRLLGSNKVVNEWDDKKRIPLGWITNADPAIPAFMRTHSLAETTLVFSKPGVGKSVITRNIYAMNWRFGLPLVIFDPTGADHRMNHDLNSDPVNIAPGVEPFGMDEHPVTGKKVKYLAVPQDELKDYEILYRPNLNELNREELESLGFSPGSAAHLGRVLKEYGPFDDFDNLVKFIERFPATPREAENISKRIKRGNYVTDHHEQYHENDSIPSSSKENLQKVLYRLKDTNLIALNGDDDFDVVSWVEEGNSVVYSFDENYKLARVVVSLICRKLIRWKKTRGKFKDLGLGFEEMDKTFPKDGGEGGMSEFISNLVLKLRKLSMKIIGSSATIQGMDENLLENCHNVIFGQMAGRHISTIGRIWNYELGGRVKNLKWDRFAPGGGYREFLLLDERGSQFVFNPFECPCEMHREIQRKGFYYANKN
jgi:DNA helicase HerA-like ATPase